MQKIRKISFAIYHGDVRLVVAGLTGAVLQDIKYLPTGAIFSIINPALQPYRFGGKDI